MLESYAASARRAVVLATAEARQLARSRIGTEHLLLGLLANGDDIAAAALRDAGATLIATRHKVAEATGPVEAVGDAPDAPVAAEPEYTPRAQRALDRAVRFARQDRSSAVGPQHLLIGVLDVEGLACQVLRGLGVDLGRLREALVRQPPDDLRKGPLDGTPETSTPETSTAETSTSAGAPAEPAALAPRCPTCAAPLADTIAVTRLDARAGAGPTRPVDVVHCGDCGTALGTLPPSA